MGVLQAIQRNHLLLCIAGYLLTSIALLSIQLQKSFVRPSTRIETNFTYDGTDYPQTWDIPPLELVELAFENTVHYTFEGKLAEREWQSMLPPGDGMLFLGRDQRPFSISMFHSLRCLNILRKGLLEFRDSKTRPPPGPLVHHCMNYLRQMIMCRTDTRIEHGRHLQRGIAVSDMTRTCKDWTAVYRAAEENNRIYMKSRRHNG